MSTLDVEVFEAFTSAGIAPDMAMKAAAALHESRDRDMGRVEGRSTGWTAKCLVWIAAFWWPKPD